MGLILIISNSRKFLFVHIYKTAGTSITKYFDDFLEWNDIVLGGTDFGEKIQGFYLDRYKLHKHSTAQDIRKIIGKETWDEFFKFAFVRHPYDRTLSTYNYIKCLINTTGIRRHLPFFKPHNGSFLNWPITKAFLDTKSFSSFIRHEKAKKSMIMKPQADWIFSSSGKKLIDFIGKFENIDNDFSSILKKIKIPRKVLRHHNKSKIRTDKHIIEKTDLKYLSEIYKKDFYLFNYDPCPDRYLKKQSFEPR